MDHMNDGFARIIFSAEVEALLAPKYPKEAEFVKLVRGALIEAADTPGIPAAERCQKLLEFDRYVL